MADDLIERFYKLLEEHIEQLDKNTWSDRPIKQDTYKTGVETFTAAEIRELKGLQTLELQITSAITITRGM